MFVGLLEGSESHRHLFALLGALLASLHPRLGDPADRLSEAGTPAMVHIGMGANVGDRLAAFLELDTPVSPLPPSARSQNAHRRHRSRRLQGWTQRQTNRAMIDGVVPFSPHRRLAIGLINRLNGTFAKREPMHEDTLKHIQDTLRPEIEALGEHLGRDLSHWVSS